VRRRVSSRAGRLRGPPGRLWGRHRFARKGLGVGQKRTDPTGLVGAPVVLGDANPENGRAWEVGGVMSDRASERRRAPRATARARRAHGRKASVKLGARAGPCMGLLDKLHRGKARPGLRPTDPCPCGSGKAVKMCCPELLE